MKYSISEPEPIILLPEVVFHAMPPEALAAEKVIAKTRPSTKSRAENTKPSKPKTPKKKRRSAQ